MEGAFTLTALARGLAEATIHQSELIRHVVVGMEPRGFRVSASTAASERSSPWPTATNRTCLSVRF